MRNESVIEEEREREEGEKERHSLCDVRPMEHSEIGFAMMKVMNDDNDEEEEWWMVVVLSFSSIRVVLKLTN